MKRHPIIIVADNIRSLENVGAMFRIADAICALEIFLVGISAYPDLGETDTRRPYLRNLQTERIKKTALSGFNTVPYSYYPTVENALEEIVKRNYSVVCVEQTEDSIPYTSDYPIEFPCCLIFGNELEGVNPIFLKHAEKCLLIPQYGVGKSLNVSVSAGIISFEVLRRYLLTHT